MIPLTVALLLLGLVLLLRAGLKPNPWVMMAGLACMASSVATALRFDPIPSDIASRVLAAVAIIFVALGWIRRRWEFAVGAVVIWIGHSWIVNSLALYGS